MCLTLNFCPVDFSSWRRKCPIRVDSGSGCSHSFRGIGTIDAILKIGNWSFGALELGALGERAGLITVHLAEARHASRKSGAKCGRGDIPAEEKMRDLLLVGILVLILLEWPVLITGYEFACPLRCFFHLPASRLCFVRSTDMCRRKHR
jgi:hypothetical protein